MKTIPLGNRSKIRGRVVEGARVGANFTQIPWVKKEFISKLSIDPYPGTLNLDIVDPESLQNLKNLKAARGIEVLPQDLSFCHARCYPVLIGGQIIGAIVFPIVEGYPENKMELIASQNIKKALSVNTGDLLEVEVFPLLPFPEK